MFKNIVFIGSLFLFTNGVVKSQKSEDFKLIKEAMSQQQLFWNKGDIPGFMTYYWNSDSLRFLSKNGMTKGWQNTLDRYLNSYDTPEKMGELSFGITSLELLEDNTILVIGSWNITRIEKEGSEGFFSLLWRKKKGKWVIVLDHTS